MCEIITLPIETVNYHFLYFRAKDTNRPLYEVWASSQKELENLCKYLSKLKKPQNNGRYAKIITESSISKKYHPVPREFQLQKDNKYHLYIEL